MVKTVVIAAILGLIIGFYLRPMHLWLARRTNNPTLSGILTLMAVILPVLIVLGYSYSELNTSLAISSGITTRNVSRDAPTATPR